MSTDLITQQPEARFVRVDKTLVDSLLALNTRNRNVRASLVEDYRKMFRSGRYVPTNQGIGVTKSGIMFDGQHRLTALRLEGYPPIEMMLLTGLDDEAAAPVDQGAGRSAADYLHFLFGKRVSSLVPAILRVIMLMTERDKFCLSGKIDPRDYATRLEWFGSSIQDVLSPEGARRLPAAILAAFVWRHHISGNSEVIAFVRQVATGEMLARSSPAFTLKKYIASSKKRDGDGVARERFNKAGAALDAHLGGRQMTRLYGCKTLYRTTRRGGVAVPGDSGL